MKMSEFFQKIKIDKITSFIKKNVRYFGAAAVLVAMVLILARCTDGTASDSNPMAGAYQQYAESDNKEVNELISKYFEYYAAGDTDSLKQIATPISDAEVSYIQFYSQYIEKYQNLKVYTKRGLDKNSYLCSVYLQIKFANIETPVAGLDFFYVQTKDDGSLYINNVYGSFNQSNGEFDMDTDVASLIATFEQQNDVLALQAEVQQQCNEAMLADENLNTFVNTTLQDAIKKWAADYKASVAKAAEEAAAAKAAEEAAAAEAAEAANAKTKVTTDKINVRDAASESGNLLGQLASGTQVTWYADENGWAKIDYNGTKAYVKADYLADAGDASAQPATEPADTSAALSQGEEITLANTVNVRESMSETASKVAVAYAGEQVTVIQSYADGWTKVNYNGKQGYCKTEYLQ